MYSCYFIYLFLYSVTIQLASYYTNDNFEQLLVCILQIMYICGLCSDDTCTVWTTVVEWLCLQL